MIFSSKLRQHRTLSTKSLNFSDNGRPIEFVEYTVRNDGRRLCRWLWLWRSERTDTGAGGADFKVFLSNLEKIGLIFKKSDDIAEGVGFATRERGEGRDNVSWSNYRPNQALVATYITEELYLVRLQDQHN